MSSSASLTAASTTDQNVPASPWVITWNVLSQPWVSTTSSVESGAAVVAAAVVSVDPAAGASSPSSPPQAVATKATADSRASSFHTIDLWLLVI